jgi:hypothetical protein
VLWLVLLPCPQESGSKWSDRPVPLEPSNRYIGFWKREDYLPMPLSYWDVAIWSAVTAVILLVTSELLSPHYGGIDVPLDRLRLRVVAVSVVLVFFVLLVIRVYLGFAFP